ncbi:MAG TPA: SAM-dependent methyltransferase [Pseudonocardiaceae bacterium]|nr:SAM-dependent methyltransferase [Pseudonocardiaceae bacterium]
MTEQPVELQSDWVPLGIDPNVPSMARTYDYLLGGAHNFAVDRQLAEAAERIMPRSREIARLNRSFLRRAVLFLVESGIRQFLDIGSGVPTVGNVHEIAQSAAPAARIVYVDKDPVAVAHSELLLQGNERTTVIQADLREPERILTNPETTRLLNFDEPIGLLTVMMLHFVPDSDDPAGAIATYRDALAAGSCLALSHVTADQRSDQISGVAEEISHARSSDQLSYRSHAEVVRFFDGFELIEPGVVGCGLWRPDGPGGISNDPEVNAHVYAGIGRKP